MIHRHEVSRTITRSVSATVLLAAVLAAQPGCALLGGATGTEADDHDGGGGDAGPSGATGALPVDCSARANVHNPACVRLTEVPPGTLGTGPRVAGTRLFPHIHGGFVDRDRVIAAVELGADPGLPLGVVLAVALDSGNRTVVSGTYEDAATGPVTVGTGPEFGQVFDVQPGPDGWYALSTRGVLRVDPATGNRTPVWEFAGTTGRCRAGAQTVVPRKNALAVGPDGTVYLAVANNPQSSGVGLVGIRGGACSVVTLTGGAAGTDRGTGPTLSGSYYTGLRFRDGNVWALEGQNQSLFRIDAATGNRRVVSSSSNATRLGDGPALGVRWLAFSADGARVWTSGRFATSAFQLTAVDLAGMNRTGYDAHAGPVVAGAGEPVWGHPTRPLVVMAMDEGFLLYDPATGNSNNLSR